MMGQGCARGMMGSMAMRFFAHLSYSLKTARLASSFFMLAMSPAGASF
jgi:hypothetical protein